MKKLLLASVALTVAATAAVAADAPVRHHKRYVKAPIYKAPPMAYIDPMYDWSGMYAGGHVGWGHVRDQATTQAAGGLLALGAINSLTSDQFIGGIQAGYNFKLSPNILIGFEGEFTWLTHGTSLTVPTLVGGTVLTNTASPDWVATAAGRLGYTVDKTMVYAKGGAAWMNANYGAFRTPAAGVPFAANDTRTGYVVGGGLEYGFSRNWSAKVEYAYLDFGTETYSIGLAGPAIPTAVKTDMQQVKLGLNYRFNSFGGFTNYAEPISTKY